MDRKAVIVLDMLNDFVTGDLKCERALHIIPNLKKLIVAARNHGVPIIYSNDAHLPLDEEVVARWGKQAIKGTAGAEVIPALRPTRKDYVVEKNVQRLPCRLRHAVERLVPWRRRQDRDPHRLAHEHMCQTHGRGRFLQDTGSQWQKTESKPSPKKTMNKDSNI